MTPPQTSQELAERIWGITGNSPDDGMDFVERDKRLVALIDAWVRVREAKVLKEASHHQPNYNYYGDAEYCTGCDWANGNGSINWETHIQSLATARKQEKS